jgi:hypothetical protein
MPNSDSNIRRITAIFEDEESAQKLFDYLNNRWEGVSKKGCSVEVIDRWSVTEDMWNAICSNEVDAPDKLLTIRLQKLTNELISYPELYERAKGNSQGLSENWKQYLFWLKSLRPQFFYDRIANQYGIETIKLSHESEIQVVIVEQEGCHPTLQLANPETITAIEAEARLFDYLPPEE